MVNEHALTVSLEEFGLSKYEAQAYVTLISKGTISASELAYYSDLPRTKVYPILLKLENKKLAIISKSKPIMCTAIAPEDAFDSIIHEQINKVNAMNTLVSKLKKASEESRKSQGSEEKRYFQIAANNVLNQLKTMIDGSKNSIQIAVDQWGLGLLSDCDHIYHWILPNAINALHIHSIFSSGILIAAGCEYIFAIKPPPFLLKLVISFFAASSMLSQGPSVSQKPGTLKRMRQLLT